jgi:hypothetical protein
MAATSRFSGKLYLVLLEGKHASSINSGRSLWGVQRPIAYQTGEDPGEIITVPAGFVTDLASIPRPVWSFYPPDGPWVKGAVIHDFLYYTQGDGLWGKTHGITRDRPYTRAQSDHVLWEAMKDRGIHAWARFVIWAAVRLGGWIGWSVKHKRARPKPTAAELGGKPAGPAPRRPRKRPARSPRPASEP